MGTHGGGEEGKEKEATAAVAEAAWTRATRLVYTAQPSPGPGGTSAATGKAAESGERSRSMASRRLSERRARGTG